MPQSLRPASVNVTNITVLWDRVDCQQRNGFIDSYQVAYYPTDDTNATLIQTIYGTEDDDRIFIVSGLLPRTSYTFEVQAINAVLDISGAPTSIDVSTSTPEGKLSIIIIINLKAYITYKDKDNN